jgi:hypothetical protein
MEMLSFKDFCFYFFCVFCGFLHLYYYDDNIHHGDNDVVYVEVNENYVYLLECEILICICLEVIYFPSFCF